MKNIKKIGLLLLRDTKLLLVRKKGGTLWILPGGKPNPKESEIDALEREIYEELGCRLAWGRQYMECKAPAADLEDTEVTVSCYLGEIAGTPSPQNEIEEIHWMDINKPDVPLAVSIEEEMLPYLQSDFR